MQIDEEMQDLRSKSDAMDRQEKEAQAKYFEAWKKADELGEVVGKLSGKRIEQNARQENVEKLRRNLKEFTQSDQELQDMLEQYETRVDTLQQSADEEKVQYGKLQKELNQIRESLSAREREMGSFESQEATHNRRVAEREQLIKETARDHSIRGFDLELGDQQIQVFMDKMSKMAKDRNALFDKTRRETQQELQQAQAVLNDINGQKSALNQRKENARSNIANYDRKMGTAQADMNRIEVDEGMKANLESAIKDVRSRLQQAKSKYEAMDWEKTVEQTERALQSLDSDNQRLNSELVEGTNRASETARIDYLRTQVTERQRSLQTMTDAHGDNIKAVVGDSWTVQSLDDDYQSALSRSSANVTQAERQRDGVSRELEQLNFKLKTVRTSLKDKREERRQAGQTVRDALSQGEDFQAGDDDPSTFPDRLAELEKEGEIVQSDAAKQQAQKEYYMDCMDTLKKLNKCRLCTRGFHDDRAGYDNLVRIIERVLSRSENRNPEDEAVETELKLARAAQPSYDVWQRLTERELPVLEEEDAKLASRHETLVADMERQDQLVSERQDEKRDMERLSKNVQNIVKYHNEMISLARQIDELVAKQPDASNLRGLEQIRDELTTNNEQARSARTTLAKLTGERDQARGSMNTMELELRDAQARFDRAVSELKEKMSLEKQITDIKAAVSEQRDSMRSADEELHKLGPKLAKAQTKYEDIDRRGNEKNRQLQEETTRLNRSLGDLQMSNKYIDDYINSGGPQQVPRARSAIQQLKQQVSGLERQMVDITKEVKQIESQLYNVEETKRSICDNQDYRRDKRAVEEVAAEIAELESHDVEAEHNEWKRQAAHWQNVKHRLGAEQGAIVGELKSKDKAFLKLSDDWNVEYKDADYKYKEAHIKVETTKAAVEDLGRYAGALDKAIMKYHTLKMEEINRIIDELWRRTYQGTDVDTILIRSDNEAAKGNKSYNYRVCMVKQDAEMDMRGRCSACLLYTSPSPRDGLLSRMPSSA